jgi:hypothetical protein
MFYGSGVHAQAAAAIFSILALCRLHKLEPWKYLDEVLRLLPDWPADRYIELAPKNWAATRTRLDPSAGALAEVAGGGVTGSGALAEGCPGAGGFHEPVSPFGQNSSLPL